MRITTFYRTLLVLGTGAYAYYWLLPSHFENQALYAAGEGASIQLTEVQHNMVFGAWILCALGMFFYVRLARDAYAVLWILMTALSPFMGLYVVTAEIGTLTGISQTLDGAVLALAFFSPVRKRFGKRRSLPVVGRDAAG